MASRSVGASTVVWLADGIACDLALPQEADVVVVSAALRTALATEPVDVIVQQAETRRKKILIADMDSTMIDQECIDELADEIGVKDYVAAITARSMNGEIAFEPPCASGRRARPRRRGRPHRRQSPDAGAAACAGADHAANGAWTALVPSGLEVFDAHCCHAWLPGNAQIACSNRTVLHRAGWRPILGRAAKADALIEISARLGLTPTDAIAVGDGANDLDMIRLAGTGVALHAKPTVAAQAKVRIDHGDLTALLYVQGYRQEEFVQ